MARSETRRREGDDTKIRASRDRHARRAISRAGFSSAAGAGRFPICRPNRDGEIRPPGWRPRRRPTEAGIRPASRRCVNPAREIWGGRDKREILSPSARASRADRQNLRLLQILMQVIRVFPCMNDAQDIKHVAFDHVVHQIRKRPTSPARITVGANVVTTLPLNDRPDCLFDPPVKLVTKSRGNC